MPTGRLDTLQILRGIAAAMVVLDHALLVVARYDPTYATYDGFAATIGRMGVNIFFVISGFIMVHSTRSTQRLAPIQRSRDFGWKRLTRLVPLYWIATFFYIAIGTVFGVRFTLVQVATSLSFLPDFADADDPRMPPIVGVGWTLNYEALFYCIFGVALLLPRRAALIACIAVIVALIVAGAGLRFVHGEPLHRIVYFYTYKNMLFFAIGIAVALGRRLVPHFSSGWALGLAVGVMVAALGFFRIMRFGDGNAIWQSISLVTCTTAVVLAVSDGRQMVGGIYRLLLHVGDASYSTYLFHAMLLGWLAAAAAPLVRSGMAVPFIVAGLLLCLAAGSLVHVAVEMPITRLFRRGRRSPPVSLAGSIRAAPTR